MRDYLDSAEKVQSNVRNDESQFVQEYDSNQVRQAVVHGREDIVLLAAYLVIANEQLKSIRHLLFTLVILVSTLLILFIKNN